MEMKQVKTAIENTPKGANIIVEWLRPVKTRAAFKTTHIEKSVRMVGRMGIDYNNIKAVQEKRENGDLPSTPQPLSWGFWVSDGILGHNKGLKKENPFYSEILPTTKYYVRLYNGTSANVRPEVHFFLDGNEVALEEIQHMLLASEIGKEKGDCFCCKFENMTRIHGEAEWVSLFAKVEQEKITFVTKPVPAAELATL